MEVGNAGNLVPGKVDFLQSLVGEEPYFFDVVVGNIKFLQLLVGLKTGNLPQLVVLQSQFHQINE